MKTIIIDPKVRLEGTYNDRVKRTYPKGFACQGGTFSIIHSLHKIPIDMCRHVPSPDYRYEIAKRSSDFLYGGYISDMEGYGMNLKEALLSLSACIKYYIGRSLELQKDGNIGFNGTKVIQQVRNGAFRCLLRS